MTEQTKKAIKEILWDYNITEDQFIKMLDSEIKPGGFDRLWAMQRAIEGMGYYDLIEIVGLKRIARDWDKLKDKLRNKIRVQGDRICHTKIQYTHFRIRCLLRLKKQTLLFT